MSDAQALAKAAHTDPEVAAQATALAEQLREVLTYYESTLNTHGIPLPYHPIPE